MCLCTSALKWFSTVGRSDTKNKQKVLSCKAEQRMQFCKSHDTAMLSLTLELTSKVRKGLQHHAEGLTGRVAMLITFL